MNIEKMENDAVDQLVLARCLYPGGSENLIGINSDFSLCTGINGRFLSRPGAQ